MENVRTAIAEILDEAQQRLGVKSDYALAKSMGWYLPTIRNYRNGRNTMNALTVLKFSRATGISERRILEAIEQDELKPNVI